MEITAPRELLPKQRQVIDALKTIKFVLYSGAFGAGKTLLLSNAVITQTLTYPRSLWLVGCQTYPMLRDTVLRTFLEELDMYQQAVDATNLKISIVKDWNRSSYTMRLHNDSEILFRSCEDPSKFKSLNLDGFALDEPVDIAEDIFLMLQGRLRGTHVPLHHGILTGNPGGFTSWVYKRFFEDKTNEYIAIQTRTRDNTFLPESYVRSMEQAYDSDYTRRYLDGVWGEFEGLIYKDFKKEKHVGDHQQNKYNYYVAGYDDGYRNAACFLVGGIDKDNRLHIVYEYFKSNRTSEEISDDIKPIYDRFGVRKIFCDPSGLNAIETFKREKMYALDADNTKKGEGSGISKLKALFKQDMVYIDHSCVNLIKELESYRYEKDKLTGNFNEEPVKKDDHAVDALRYLVTEYDPFRRFTPGVAFDWNT